MKARGTFSRKLRWERVARKRGSGEVCSVVPGGGVSGVGCGRGGNGGVRYFAGG